MGFGSNVNKGKQPAYDLNAEHVDDDQFGSDCPVCLEPMVNKDDDRTIVKLQCDHTFHLGKFSFLCVKKKTQIIYLSNIFSPFDFYCSFF